MADGRASPAQLTGRVARGDVLLAIDGKSIVKIPIDQLVVGLKPLSSPTEGAYKRSLNLRFSAGEGLELLDKDKEAQKTKPDMFNMANFMPSEVPLVDQHSGMPLFEVGTHATEIVATESVAKDGETSTIQSKPIEARALTINDHISNHLTKSLSKEKATFVSQYFAWNDKNTELMRPTQVIMVAPTDETNALEQKKKTLEQGNRAIHAAKAFSYSMEDIDKGQDLRSFKAWNSNMSLRSRASTRRRYVMDTATLIGSTAIEEAPSDDDSAGSSNSGEDDGMNGDALLLQLAAHDAIWKKQVIETIENAIKEMDENEKHPEEKGGDATADKLGSLFLGDQVNNLLTKKKRSYALPPDEVTSVLFDLVTNLASTTPDEISLRGKFELNPQTSLLPFQKTKLSAGDDRLLASHFVINEVFPSWLKSFRPLPWDERRVLWPYTRSSTATDTTYTGGDSLYDGLTLDSGSIGESQSMSQGRAEKKKSLREKIEDMHLHVESRAEA